MKKLNILKTLILITSVLFSTGKAFCEATAVQAAYTLVQPTVAVDKTSPVTSGSIDPTLNGKSTTLTSYFNLQSNDETTFFVVYSTLQIEGGTVSAFDSTGNLMFGNTTHLPTKLDVDNARANISGNANVIAYPFVLSGDNIDFSFTTSDTYKECYKVTLENPLETGFLTQTVGGMPVTNTYSTRDQSGTYKAIVYVTAATKL